MVSLEVIALVLTGLSITASIVYYANVIQNSIKARHRELIFQRGQVYNLEYSKAFGKVYNMRDWKTPEEFNEKYGMYTNPDEWAYYMYITRAYNIGGLLLQENMVDADLVFKLYPPFSVINLWETFGPLMVNLRERTNYPDAYKSFEYLYEEAKKRYPNITPV
jgi:hypothetical protein